jgi:hypothetical protein
MGGTIMQLKMRQSPLLVTDNERIEVLLDNTNVMISTEQLKDYIEFCKSGSEAKYRWKMFGNMKYEVHTLHFSANDNEYKGFFVMNPVGKPNSKVGLEWVWHNENDFTIERLF